MHLRALAAYDAIYKDTADQKLLEVIKGARGKLKVISAVKDHIVV
jgi:hypothetical protein